MKKIGGRKFYKHGCSLTVQKDGVDLTRIAIFGRNEYLDTQLAAYFVAKDTACDIFDMLSFDVTHAECWIAFNPTDYSAILFLAA